MVMMIMMITRRRFAISIAPPGAFSRDATERQIYQRRRTRRQQHRHQTLSTNFPHQHETTTSFIFSIFIALWEKEIKNKNLNHSLVYRSFEIFIPPSLFYWNEMRQDIFAQWQMNPRTNSPELNCFLGIITNNWIPFFKGERNYDNLLYKKKYILCGTI